MYSLNNNFELLKNKVFEYPCSDPYTCKSSEVHLEKGKYRIECYGAAGGDSGSGKGGFGAYVSGTILLKSARIFYLFIGAKGHTQLATKTYNGGGRGCLQYCSESVAASGGGSTDIRLVNSDNITGLLSRIMVAGAGGGAESYETGTNGGNSGFFEGKKGEYVIRNSVHSPSNDVIEVPTGGNRDSGGKKGICVKFLGSACSSDWNGFDGEFGKGGDASNFRYGGGGGSGYFGGGGGTISNAIVSSGAGGSSYVSGKKGFHSFVANNDGTIKDINSEFHSSGLFFTQVNYREGASSQCSGNGKVIITRLGGIISFANDTLKNRLFRFLIACITVIIEC